jgi:hypothetical protein
MAFLSKLSCFLGGGGVQNRQSKGLFATWIGGIFNGQNMHV